MIVYHLGFELSVVVSNSMSPGLEGTNVKNGDWVLMEKVSYWFRAPRRWEVVAFPNQEGISVMKRVVALPGETISIKDRWAAVNGVPLLRPPGLLVRKYYPYGNLARGASVECKDGFYVLGDYSIDSCDSRWEGTVPREKIRGRAWLIVWPLSRLSFATLSNR